MSAKQQILKEFALFSVPTSGIGDWLSDNADPDIFNRLARIESEPLSIEQFNQLLILGREAPMSDGMFNYYWLEVPRLHPYPPCKIPEFESKFHAEWVKSPRIISLDHLKWGLYRLYIDGLLYFGNVRAAYLSLRDRTHNELEDFYAKHRFETDVIKSRGPALPMRLIAQDDRYFISEMACKSYGDTPGGHSALKDALLKAYRTHATAGKTSPTIRELLESKVESKVEDDQAMRQTEFLFSVDEVLDVRVTSEQDMLERYKAIADRFFKARQAALDNTSYYLSMANDLDVYVATSMRIRDDFRLMCETCELIFNDKRLESLNLRYFDPTLSAAKGHEDKGLIECLMVKCAKVLVYCAGEKDSWGKDAEAAMALSLGKPVIFYCDKAPRTSFYRDVHPLSRLIEFKTGVAVGAMIADSIDQVVALLSRLFENQMVYKLDQPKHGYLRLKEVLSDSVVRLQTDDQLLTRTFWNLYHGHKEAGIVPNSVAG